MKVNVNKTERCHASAGGNGASLSSKRSRVHPTPTESTKKFGEVTKAIHSRLAVTSYITRLKHEKPQPKDLGTQYDKNLEQLYLKEWPDAVRQYNTKQLHCRCCQPCCSCCQSCCCRYDPGMQKDTRELFKKVFPTYIFYFLVFTGAIPAGNKKFRLFVRVCWSLITAVLVWYNYVNFMLFYWNLACDIDANCFFSNVNMRITFSISNLINVVAMTIPVFLVPTYLRHQFQSRELQTLISSVGPGRVGGPTYCWSV